MKLLYQLISRSALVALCVVSCSMFSCEGDEGPEGPIGPQGEQGEQGTPGEQGPKGEDALTKTGYFEGTIKGTLQEESFTETFKYEYSNTSVEAIEGNFLQLVRYRDGKIPDSNFENEPNAKIPMLKFDLYFQNQEQQETESFSIDEFSFTFNKEIDNLTIFYFTAEVFSESSVLEITNYVHDSTTGVLSFDFSFTDPEGSYNSTRNPVTITGKFNSGTKVYKNVLGIPQPL